MEGDVMPETELDSDAWGYYNVGRAKAVLKLKGFSIAGAFDDEITEEFTAALHSFQLMHGLEINDGSWTDETITALRGLPIP